MFIMILNSVNRADAKAEQSRAEQSRAEQSRAEQSRAEQSRAEQSRAEQKQSRTEQLLRLNSPRPVLRALSFLRIAKIAAIAAAAMTAFQACADVRSAAFSKKKSAEPISTKPVEDPVGTKPVEEEDLPICDEPGGYRYRPTRGKGTTDDPFVLCRPAHLRLIRQYGN